jgi:excisionase family DNA binding protein
MDTERRALSTPEAAHALSVTPQTVRNLIAGGRLRAVRVGRKYLVIAESLDEFLSSGSSADEVL